MKFERAEFNLPLILAGGVSVPLSKHLLISFDLKHFPYESKTTFGTGAEFALLSILSLRAGYLANAVSSQQQATSSFSGENEISRLAGLGMGFGLKLWSSTLDYAFTPAGELGNIQRISLSLKF